MSDVENDEKQTSREEEHLAKEIYFLIVRTITEKGVVKISDLRKVYAKAVSNDKTVQYRPIQDVLAFVNANLKHWQGWTAVLQEDRLTYLDCSTQMPVGNIQPNETKRISGILKNALMYVFAATRPAAMHPGVPHDELMTYMETSLSTSADNKCSSSDMELLKKLIAPTARADFVKKGYLSYTKGLNEKEEEVFRYEWGPTALQTFDPIEMVSIFQKLNGVGQSENKDLLQRAIDLWREQREMIKNGAVFPTRGNKH